MSAPAVTLVSRAARLVKDLEFALATLRAGIATGGLSLPKQRHLVQDLREAPRLVCELVGAVDAYRECALQARPTAAPLPPVDDARPFHLSDEEVR